MKKNNDNFLAQSIVFIQITTLISCLFFGIGYSQLWATAAAPTSTPTLAQTEAAVRSYFANNPAMISVAKCESGFRQFNNDGTPLLGSGRYIGIFQIDYRIHASAALKMGMDIYTVDGNLAYAKYLFGLAGTRPWAGCVRPDDIAAVKPPADPKPAANLSLTRNLKSGDIDPQVKILQQMLNNAGFVVAKSGPGSLGEETDKFGSLTRTAVRRFQCAKKIVCGGDEATTGYGSVGPLTRKRLEQAAK